MSTIVQAINGHAAHEFETFMKDLLKEKGFENINTFSRALGMANSGGLYGYFRGRQKLTPKTAARWSEVLAVSPEVLLEANKPIAVLKTAKKPLKKTRRKSPGLSVVLPVTSPDEVLPFRKPAPEITSGERFSMSVNADGTARVRLNVPDLPLELALRLVEAMGLPELINNGASSTRRITHEKKEN